MYGTEYGFEHSKYAETNEEKILRIERSLPLSSFMTNTDSLLYVMKLSSRSLSEYVITCFIDIILYRRVVLLILPKK